MSNRDSLGYGDLIPQDVADVFAQEKHTKRGRKKRSHSLGQALGWLKGKKKKDLRANGQSLGLGPALDLALDMHPAGQKGGHKAGKQAGKQAHPQGNSHGITKQGNDDKTPVPPLLQENVFIEASRPKYLEDLHTEALEGLKMMQEEETNNGTDYGDNESTISNATVQAEGDAGGFMTDSTIADTSSIVSTQSSVSTRSSRSGLTRQASTFRPLNSGKKSEKSKSRRRHRKTVMGIPHHVQRELGLDRVNWMMGLVVDEEQLLNGGTNNNTDGPQQARDNQKGASASGKNTDILQTVSEGEVEQFSVAHSGHKDDLALLHRLGPNLSSTQRPRSLAVPWMTTANSLKHEPPSPVMTMSPQAAYMSKIIPNAVLPPSIDVVEISRGRSRNSVRTVSKSSLLLASPASSRASSRASSSRDCCSRASTMTSASRYNPLNLSDSSGWSNSESSDTLVSDSSTISSSSTPRQRGSQNGDFDSSANDDNVSVHTSISKASKCTSNGKVIGKRDDIKNEGAVARSLSVIKSKKAPPPPSRSYSLHNKMKRRSRDLAEFRVISGSSSPQSILASGEKNAQNKPEQMKETGSPPVSPITMDSPGYTADTSSLDESTGSVPVSPIKPQQTEDNVKVEESVRKDASPEKQKPLLESKLKKTISPSSGYSSQDGTPPQLSKQSHSSSPRHKRGILAKLQSLFPGSTPAPAISTPSLLTQPETPENTKSTKHPKLQPISLVDTVNASPSVRALMELFNIPPPPKIHAPPPPPPEVWAHNKRTFELLLGPPAPNDIYAVVKKNPKDRRQQRQSPPVSREGSVKSLPAERKQKPVNGSIHVLETKKVQESELLNAEVCKENNERLAHTEQQVDLKGTIKVTEKDERVRVSELSGMAVKAAVKREERLAAKTQEDDKAHTQTSVSEVRTKTDTLPAISLIRISPSPSPPPSHQPPEPPTNPIAAVTVVQAAMSTTSEWPPPPPPMEPASETLVRGNDEVEFPLPPPPLFSEEGLAVAVPPEKLTPGTTVLQEAKISVVNTESVMVATEASPQIPSPAAKPAASTSQWIPTPPLSIPPPPAYAAPTPPVKQISPALIKNASPTPFKVVSPLSKEVSSPLIKDATPPPPKEISPPPSKEVSPLPPKGVSPAISPPLVIEVFPPPPKEVSPPPPKEVSPPPPKEISPPPHKEVSPPPPKEISPPPHKEVSPPSPKEISPPPHKEVSPPPPKEISPPPHKEVSPPPPKEISPPPHKEVSPPPPKEISPPPHKEVSPPPPKEISPPPPKEVSPPTTKEGSPSPPSMVFPPPVKDISLPRVIEVSPPPPKEISPLPPKEVSPPPTKEVSPPPPSVGFLPPIKDISPPVVIKVSSPTPKEVSPPPPKEVSPPPPKEVSPPPPKEVSPAPPKEVSPPPPKEVSPPPPKEVSPSLPNVVFSPPVKDISPQMVVEVSPPTPKEVFPPPPKEVSPPPPKEVSPLPLKEVSPPPPKEVSPLPPNVVFPPPAKDISPPLVKEVSAPSAEEVAPPSSQEKACPPSEEATPTPILPPKKNIPPPPSHETMPPPQSQPPPSGHTTNISVESFPAEPETNLPSWSSILTPPQSIPPPPSVLLSPPEITLPNTDDVTAQEVSPSPPSEFSIPPPPESSPSPQKALEPAPSPPVNIPVPQPLPVEAPASIQPEPSHVSTENQSQEQTSPPAPQEDPTPVVTPSPLQIVTLRSLNSSPEPTISEDQVQAEVTMRTQQPSIQAPQKPIRRSLIITSPTSKSPPASIASQPAVPKPQVIVALPSSSSTTVFPTKTSPPAITISPSMNLQEAIRLRTAARSKNGPPSRLSLHSPTSPSGGDLRKSPSSTASFIFSKSNKKMVIVTTPPPNAKENFQKTLTGEVSSVTRSVSEPESLKTGVKVPPPVAKKPKTKAKDIVTEQTVEQDAQSGSNKGSPEKQNGTAGTVEGGQTSST